MGFLYVISVILLVGLFILIKKSDEKVNLINIGIISVIAYLAYNIFVCMILGSIGITTNLLVLSIVNILISILMGIKIYKDKKIQSFEIRIKDFIAVIVAFIIVSYMAVNQYKPLARIVNNASVDASMHYSAATNFANNMIILSKIDNQTGYNFKTMQTGAYINTGILMSTMRSIAPQIEDFVTFKLFEAGIMFLMAVSIYTLFADKLKTKMNFIVGMIFLGLYAFAYPYTSLLYGFSYLSVAIVFATGLFYLAKIYDKKVLDFKYYLPLVILMGVGIVFSYCLFVPALYSFICIHIFVKDLLNKDEKKYLKIFSKKVLLVTGILLVVTILSILYLVVPTFTDADQNKLTDAIGFAGQIYSGFIVDFIFYIPFTILFVYYSLKKKDVNYQIISLAILVFQTIISLLGCYVGIVSAYYYYKIYSIIWILLCDVAVEVICDLDENKELRCFAYSAIVVWLLIIYSALSGFEIKLKERSPMLINDFRTQQLAGVYFETNILAINNMNVSCIVDTNRIEIAEAMGKIDDITLKNMLCGGMNTTCKAWIYVIAGIPCGGESINDLQKVVVETNVDDFMKDDTKEYFVLFTGDKYESTDDYEVIYSNPGGVILHKTK